MTSKNKIHSRYRFPFDVELSGLILLTVWGYLIRVRYPAFTESDPDLLVIALIYGSPVVIGVLSAYVASRDRSILIPVFVFLPFLIGSVWGFSLMYGLTGGIAGYVSGVYYRVYSSEEDLSRLELGVLLVVFSVAVGVNLYFWMWLVFLGGTAD